MVRRINVEEVKKDDRKNGFKYEVIYGARRLFACQFNKIPLLVTITDKSDKECLALMHIENAQRKDITPMERAKSVASNFKHYSSYGDMASLWKESKSYIESLEKAGRIWFFEKLKKLFVDLRNLPVSTAKKLSFLLINKKGKLEKVIDNISLEESLPILSDKEKAKRILSAAESKGEAIKNVYSTGEFSFKVDGVGVVDSRLNEKGEVTVRMLAAAAKVNKKQYSDIIVKAMEGLGLR